MIEFERGLMGLVFGCELTAEIDWRNFLKNVGLSIILDTLS